MQNTVEGSIKDIMKEYFSELIDTCLHVESTFPVTFMEFKLKSPTCVSRLSPASASSLDVGGLKPSPQNNKPRPIKQGVLVEVKVFIDVFKFCTFSTDQIKEFVGTVYLCIVGRDMDKGKEGRRKKKSHKEIEKNTPQVTRTFSIIRNSCEHQCQLYKHYRDSCEGNKIFTTSHGVYRPYQV